MSRRKSIRDTIIALGCVALVHYVTLGVENWKAVTIFGLGWFLGQVPRYSIWNEEIKKGRGK